MLSRFSGNRESQAKEISESFGVVHALMSFAHARKLALDEKRVAVSAQPLLFGETPAPPSSL
jgi:hypothetical protein